MDRKRDDAVRETVRGLGRVSPHQVPHELLLDLFDSLEYGVLAVDAELKVTAVNAAALAALKLNPRLVLGRPAADILRPQDQSGPCPLRRTLADGRPVPGQEALLADGLGHLVPVWLSTTPLRDGRGRLTGAVATLRFPAGPVVGAEQEESAGPLGGIVTGDPSMRKLFGLLPTIARSDSSVLVQGETGTGKSQLVKAIHGLSGRRRGPLVTVNCAALPESLLEAELFGVRAGAFTGATRDRPGRLAAAGGGTLFLDEIGDIPLSVQVKLLRVLQERIYEPLGDVRPAVCDARFIGATHRDLAALVEQGAFRRDLYYRINVLKVELPPLRERKGDIPLLTQRFLNRLSQGRGKRVRGVSSRVLEILTNHDYPGNIRELENIVEHAWVMCREDVVEVQHLPAELQQRRWAFAAPGPADRRPLPRVEAEYIREVLERHRGHRGATARELGIHRTTLIRKIQRLGLELPAGDGRSARLLAEDT